MLENVRDIVFSIRLSAAEYNALKRISAKHNTTMAGYLRMMVIDELLEECEAAANGL